MAAFFVVALAVVFYALLFIAANPQWVPVFLPTPPWSTEHIWFGFETSIPALIAIGMLIGAGISVAISVPMLRRAGARLRERDRHLEAVTKELEKTERLMTHSRREHQESQ